VTYTANGNDIAALFFSVDFDEANLIFDDTNTTGLPWPDSITVNPLINPFIFSIGFTYEPGDTDGELDFTFTDTTLPFTALPEVDLVTITFIAGPNTAVAPVNFSQDPNATAGNTVGADVPVTTVDGSVSITSDVVCGDGVVDPATEDCDDGAANGTTICGCQTDCSYTAAGTNCDDGQFCNGTDTCNGNGACQAGTPPCDPATETCNEGNDICEPFPTGCQSDAECDDGAFCNGVETCDATGKCQSGTDLCAPGETCDEANDICVATTFEELISDFGPAYGIWVRYGNGSWEQLHGLSPEIVVVGDIDCNGLDDLIVDFGATFGIWVRYDDGSWEQLHGLSPEIMVVGDIDGNGCDDLIVDFGATFGIWVRYDDGSWEQLHGLSPEIMTVGNIDGH
jgi:hypothetical protein